MFVGVEERTASQMPEYITKRGEDRILTPAGYEVAWVATLIRGPVKGTTKGFIAVSSVRSTRSPMVYAACSHWSLLPDVSPAIIIGTRGETPLGRLKPGTVRPGVVGPRLTDMCALEWRASETSSEEEVGALDS